MDNNTKEVLIKYLEVLLAMFEKDRMVNRDFRYAGEYGTKYDVFEYFKKELTEIREKLIKKA